jgi:hypothetical protein
MPGYAQPSRRPAKVSEPQDSRGGVSVAYDRPAPPKIAPTDKPGGKFDSFSAESRFEVVEGFTEGKGAYVRWRMEVERGNAGFQVYRISKMGEVPISNFIPGSVFSYGNHPLYGGEYNFFDPKGGLGSTYIVEAISDRGVSIRSNTLTPTYVTSIESVDGGPAMKAEAFTFKPGANVVRNDLVVSAELNTEIETGLIEPNPSKHLEVISQPGVRIQSKADGLIRVSKTQLQDGGFDVNSNSANWQVYLQGVELPMIVGANADYIEFFGKGLDSVESDIRTYYLISGVSAGRRIQSQTVRRPITSVQSRKYNQTFVRQDKKNYFNQVLNGQADNWWGDVVIQNASNNPTNLNFVLSGIDRTAGTRKMTISFQGFSITPHVIQLTLNGQVVTTVQGAGRVPFNKEFEVPVDLLLDGNNVLAMRATGGTLPTAGDIVILNKVTIDFPRDYVATNNKLEFYTDNYKNSKVSGFTTPNVRVFDVTYENTPRLLTNLEVVETNGTWGPVMPANRERLLYAVGDGVYGAAMSVTPNNPEVLQQPSHAGSMVLIAHPSLLAEAQTWANYRAGQGVVTKVVNVNDIFDEFSYGVSSSFAIEDFLLYAKNNWQTPPSYVMLFGDAHYDTRNYFGTGYWNQVPSRLVDTLYTETGSDEALTDFNNDGLAEIPIGRAAARTPAGVTALFNKTVAWEAALNANSLDRGVLFAFDWPDGYNFEAMSDRVMSKLPASVPKTRVAHSIFNTQTNTWQADPNAQANIIAGINEVDGGTAQVPGPNAGQYLVNYTGHGTASAWRAASFFSSDQAPQLTNANYPSVMVALTCLNGYFMSNAETFAEVMTRTSNGGAVAIWASTGLTTPDVQEIMANRFYTKLGEGSIPRIGDLIADAKAQVPAGADVRLSWALLGDPMLKIR